jgi:hypothetical protein
MTFVHHDTYYLFYEQHDKCNCTYATKYMNFFLYGYLDKLWWEYPHYVLVLHITPSGTSEAESKENHGVWDPMPELAITSPYVHSRAGKLG